MDPSQSLPHLLLKLQTDRQAPAPPPQPFPGLDALPPPAYTPAHPTIPLPGNSYTDPYTDDESETDNDGHSDLPPPPIVLRVDAPLKVIGHANIVCSDTQTIAAQLASAVAASIQASLAAAGDTARARPLEVVVGCGVTVMGSKNIVGDGMAKVLLAKAAALKLEVGRNARLQRSTAVETRKRRAESEPPGVQSAKRMMTEK
ncbi:MAG: hypothetical protein M1839_001076 [Geoglossum umbratile]|nr:MAG: hypothetical protein M1839_001076 [Geoglossum umbratile]